MARLSASDVIRIVLFLIRQLIKVALLAVQLALLLYAFWSAYEIRMYPIKEFGYLIHEFDPWFNYRAAEYMAEHGVWQFFKWYDYQSWYPIGRPIGTTTYPGMQMTAVAIWEEMKKVPAFKYKLPAALSTYTTPVLKMMKTYGFLWLPKQLPNAINWAPMSVNDICCLMPPWFGSLATLFTGLLTYEISRSVNAAVISSLIMAIIPAHLMRSVGGEFDNEAVAMTAIVATFYFWLRSVRNPHSWGVGVVAGLSYVYMVAAWGGYIFVLNMIGIHALMLVGLGRFNSGVYKAYTLFFLIGTAGAIQIPVVGWTPLRSVEQLGPLLVFLGYQVLGLSDMMRRKHHWDTKTYVIFRIKAMAVLLVALAAIACPLYQTGCFGPISSRIRGLFMKHTKTGNPLVDSVAEHSPASEGIYYSYLNLPLDFVLYGGAVSFLNRNNGFYFMCLYGIIAQHFSGKMSRLVLICGPICSIAAAIWFGFLLDQIVDPVLLIFGKQGYSPVEQKKPDDEKEKDKHKEEKSEEKKDEKERKKDDRDEKKEEQKKSKPKTAPLEDAWPVYEYEEADRPGGIGAAKRAVKRFIWRFLPAEAKETYMFSRVSYDRIPCTLLRLAFGILVLYAFGAPFIKKVKQFGKHCDDISRGLSNPQVVYMAQTRSGETILVDDYLKGYQWIEKNTPKDSRVMAWWDYGYQITGIAKRTSIADGNTWNHEHIATLGRTLTSPEKKAWNAIRHLADYVLVWAGGQGDDLGKSPHLARIGNSVFPEHCGDDDPKCNKFSFYEDGSPTPMMAKSLLYKLCQHKVTPGVTVDPKLFQEVHTTQHGLMRVYKVMNVSKESKAWVADPKNRVCDAPGSWYCVGQYPPALAPLIAKRRSFAQIEDFNKKGGEKSAYTKLIDDELRKEL